jgi:DDE superfamily endonuclease/Helix-turn-helix of DDE superfamily endonuclease
MTRVLAISIFLACILVLFTLVVQERFRETMKNSYLDTLKCCRSKKFRRRVGIRRRTFCQIVKQVRADLVQQRTRQPLTRRGKPSTALTRAEKLLLTFIYLRQYPTFDELGAMFRIRESYANKLYHYYLDILVRILRLPGKRALLDPGLPAILVDVTEQPIERPTRKQRQFYSGKKKRQTIKVQLIVCLKTLHILLVVCGKGHTPDFTLLKRCKLRILTALKKYADSGDQGLLKLYANSSTPIKKPKNRELTKEERQYNRELATLRINIEHGNRRCKIFRIVKATYRGKHKHYHKTWTIVAALLNLRYAQ